VAARQPSAPQSISTSDRLSCPREFSPPVREEHGSVRVRLSIPIRRVPQPLRYRRGIPRRPGRRDCPGCRRAASCGIELIHSVPKASWGGLSPLAKWLIYCVSDPALKDPLIYYFAMLGKRFGMRQAPQASPHLGKCQ
jgi:hypothetical protein